MPFQISLLQLDANLIEGEHYSIIASHFRNKRRRKRRDRIQIYRNNLKIRETGN